MFKKYFRQFVAVAICAALMLGTVFAVLIVQAVGRIRLHSYAHVDTHHISIMLEQIYHVLQQQDQLWLDITNDFAIDTDTLELELLVSAVPREFGANSRATLTLQDESMPMQLQNGRFEGRVALPTDHHLGYRITLYSGGVYRNEQFPLFMEHMFDGLFWHSGGYTMRYHNWNVTLHYNEIALPFNDSAVAVRIIVEEDGVETASFAMENGSLDFSHTFAAPGFVFGEVVGESGLTYRYTLQALLAHEEFWNSDIHVPALRVSNAAGDYIELGMHSVLIGF